MSSCGWYVIWIRNHQWLRDRHITAAHQIIGRHVTMVVEPSIPFDLIFPNKDLANGSMVGCIFV